MLMEGDVSSFPTGVLSPHSESEARRHLVRSTHLPAHPAPGIVLHAVFVLWPRACQAVFTNSLYLLFFPVNIRSLSVIKKSCRLVPNGLCLVKTRIYSFLFFQKRVCKPLEAVPNEVDARLIDCAMELDSKQKASSGCGPWATKTKQNSMVCLHHQHIYLLERI